MGNPNSYIASIEEVIVFLRDLKHVVSSEDCELDILSKKKDEDDSDPYTTANTMLDLDYDTDDVKNEILSLSEKDYIETIKDNKDTNRPPFWVFVRRLRKEMFI